MDGCSVSVQELRSAATFYRRMLRLVVVVTVVVAVLVANVVAACKGIKAPIQMCCKGAAAWVASDACCLSGWCREGAAARVLLLGWSQAWPILLQLQAHAMHAPSQNIIPPAAKHTVEAAVLVAVVEAAIAAAVVVAIVAEACSGQKREGGH